MIGKKIRLERIIDRDSRKTVIIPMDHGVTVGPIEGLADMRETVSNVVAGGANAILMHKGIVRAGHRGTGRDIGLIIHLSGGTSLRPDPNAKELVCSVEEALKLGADAVSVHINLGAETDKELLGQLGFISERCLQWQMPLIAMMYTRGPKIKNEFDVENVKHAAAECLGKIGDARAVSPLIDCLKDLPTAGCFDEVLVPGEPEDNCYDERVQNGVPLPDGTIRNLRSVAENLKLELPTFL